LEENGELGRPCKDGDGEITRASEEHAGDPRVNAIKLGLAWPRVEDAHRWRKEIVWG
jgi:hypothetical protein